MNILQSLPISVKKAQKRLGRGYGSGVGGHTVGRGQKGQKSRNSVPLWFEGGQLPLIKRLPMLRGKGRLKSLNLVENVTLEQLVKLNKDHITLDDLKAAKLVKRTASLVKVLAKGTLTKKITVEGMSVSQTVKELLEKAGGSVLNK